jgi:hypothetical protein
MARQERRLQRRRVAYYVFMREATVRGAGLVITVAYASFIGWLYARQPATIAEVTGGLSAAVGAYRIDQEAFESGLRHFRDDRFVEARAAFERADPAHRDARTQFYIGYAYYREGWGRLYSDDTLFRQGLEAAERALALAPEGRFVADGLSQQIQTADELKAELESGLRREAADFNPLRVFRERK